MPEALGCVWPHAPEGRGIGRVTLRWSLEHAQVPYLTLPPPPHQKNVPEDNNEIYQRGPKLEVDFGYANFFLASDPPTAPVQVTVATAGEGGNGGAKSNSLWEISRSPWILCGTPRQSPQCVPLVCEKFAENPEFRVGNFAVHLKRSLSHAKLKRHEIPPPHCK